MSLWEVSIIQALTLYFSTYKWWQEITAYQLISWSTEWVGDHRLFKDLTAPLYMGEGHRLSWTTRNPVFNRQNRWKKFGKCRKCHSSQQRVLPRMRIQQLWNNILQQILSSKFELYMYSQNIMISKRYENSLRIYRILKYTLI